jgi:hypothetical protein
VWSFMADSSQRVKPGVARSFRVGGEGPLRHVGRILEA